jgi:beta-glucuronidase
MLPRRRFLTTVSRALALAPATLNPAGAETPPFSGATDDLSLCGQWLFRTDPENAGEQRQWFSERPDPAGWKSVTVPHTWQIEPQLADYRGVAWYRRSFDAPSAWRDSAVRVEFEAIFHSARVWVNDKPAGEHLRKGYTAFTIDATPHLRWGQSNTITVRVDGGFNEHMLPRGRSSDWAHDGGIYRPVQLLVTPKVYIERLAIEAQPDLANGSAKVEIDVIAHNAFMFPGVVAANISHWSGTMLLRIIDEQTGLAVVTQPGPSSVTIRNGQPTTTKLFATISKPSLWHFDHPNLYRAEVTITTLLGSPVITHTAASTFGVRKFEVKNGGFYLNGERVRLMGVERMAGSNPEYGMAEPAQWIDHDHDDLKNLNCVFTRVHWQQDRRVLDYCDRHGILMQSEVPCWGPKTFQGMGEQPDADILENGFEQLREMVARDRNHPSIVVWGLCNEIDGQNPPAYNFAKAMLAEAKRLDPQRLCSYASHSLRKTPGRDVAGLMDFVEVNEYFGSWYPGGASAVAQSLDEIHAAFPDKPIVISEYGYCACTADRPEGDERRREILETHDAIFRKKDYISGLIFFCYNDYRTHVGDRGLGVLQQRVHGVVDLYGERKQSYPLLRNESSPIDSIEVEGHPKQFTVTVRTREHVPAYTLRGYTLRGVYYGYGDIPIEQKAIALPDLVPGQEHAINMAFSDSLPLYVVFDVLRPAGFSAYTKRWSA